jgi:hypothetical protein
LQSCVLGAEVEQPLFGVEPEVDRRCHVVGAHLIEVVLVAVSVGGALDQVGIGGARLARELRVQRVPAVLHELDHPRGVGQMPLTLQNSERPRSARHEVHPAVVHPFQYAVDLARTPDVAQPIVGEPDDPELALGRQALGHHRLVAILEDVERDQLSRERDEPQREQGKVMRQLGRHERSLGRGGTRRPA